MKPLWMTALACLLVAKLGTGAAETPAAWTLALRPARDAAVFDVAEDARLTATVANVRGSGAGAWLRYEVTDWDGLILAAGRVETAVPRGETRNVELLLAGPRIFPREECLTARVTLEADGSDQAVRGKCFGFLPKRTAALSPVPSPFGLLSEHSWPLLQRLGVRWVRPNWTWAERPMEWAKRYGVGYCALMGVANGFVRGEVTEQEYTQFVGESVRRFKGCVRYWQLGNEFDVFHRGGPRSYVEAQRIGCAAAKAADPGCVVVGGSITDLEVRKAAWTEALDAGLAKYCDAYDFHFYSDLQTTEELLDFIHASCRARRAEKPIWVTETTQFGTFDPDDRNQAEFVFKRFAHLLANGVSVVCWHALDWPYPFSADKTAATALVDHDGFARPGLFAYAALTRELAGARFRKRWPVGNRVYALEFRCGARSRLVVWSDGRSRGELAISVAPGSGPAWRRSISGRREPAPSANGSLRVTPATTPAIWDLPRPVARLTAGSP